MNFYELDDTNYLLTDNTDDIKYIDDEEIHHVPVNVYSKDKDNIEYNNKNLYDKSSDKSKVSENNDEILNKLYQARIDDKKFIEEQSKNMVSLVEIIDAYQTEQNILKNRIKQNDKLDKPDNLDNLCKLQLDFTNSKIMDTNTTNLKQYVKLEMLLLTLLFVLIIYVCLV